MPRTARTAGGHLFGQSTRLLRISAELEPLGSPLHVGAIADRIRVFTGDVKRARGSVVEIATINCGSFSHPRETLAIFRAVVAPARYKPKHLPGLTPTPPSSGTRPTPPCKRLAMVCLSATRWGPHRGIPRDSSSAKVGGSRGGGRRRGVSCGLYRRVAPPVLGVEKVCHTVPGTARER